MSQLKNFRFLNDLPFREELAIKILVDVICDNEKMYKSAKFQFEDYVRKEFSEKLAFKANRKVKVKQPVTIIGSGEVYDSTQYLGHFFDDMNPGDGYAIFPNPHKLSEKKKWSTMTAEKIYDLRNTVFNNNIHTSRLSSDYLEAEEIMLHNLIIMYKDIYAYLVEYTKKTKKTKDKNLINLPIYLVEELEVQKLKLGFLSKYVKKMEEGVKSKKYKRALIIPTESMKRETFLIKIPLCFVQEIFRKLFILRINQKEIWTRCFADDNDENIFVLLKATDTTIAKKAQFDKMVKEIEIGYVDIQSFQPYDIRYRPYVFKDSRFEGLTEEEMNQQASDVKIPTKDLTKDKGIAEY